MFLRNLYCLGCNNLNNQHWNRCLFCLFSFVFKKKMLLMIKNWVLKKVLIISIELTNGKSQTNIDQKLNLLFLQRHDQSQKC